jgi:hypothetical protein
VVGLDINAGLPPPPPPDAWRAAIDAAKAKRAALKCRGDKAPRPHEKGGVG